MRNKIDYGIDLGTTNSAIARMENGVPTIKKSDLGADTFPSCVHFNKRQDILVGGTAINQMKNDSTRALKTFEKGKTNTFIEFKRTMGSTHTYDSANMNKSYTSEQLSAEVLKTLKSVVTDENISSIVITVPAKFLNPQKEATKIAAELAGFNQVELLQEPIAAAIAYGLNTKTKNGYWLVFDFGGGTFDAALIKAEHGILSVKDTEGDNWLGGKNLDDAIVDKIIIPNLINNFAIDFILEDPLKKELLRSAVKFKAEEAKIQLSFKPTYKILSDLGDLPFEDENGDEPEIDVEITQLDLENVLCPIFQKAIDITKELLNRNHLKGTDLGALILVGGPTHSPILRRMLIEQITKNVDTSVDPMTVVAEGAALFASTITAKGGVMDNTKLQLDLKYESTSIELDERISIKVLQDKTIGKSPNKVFINLIRTPEGWASGKKLISDKATSFEVLLEEDRSNSFEILAYDETGNRLECQPNQFNIIQGIDGLDKMTILPYHIGIGKFFHTEEKDLFIPVKGLEKNKPIGKSGVTGVINGLKTRSAIRPGIIEDKIRIPIYQGEYNSYGSNPLFNNLVNEVIITGETLPAHLPKGSDVDITIKIDRSEQMNFSAYFPLLNYTEELSVDIKATKPPTENELAAEISKAKKLAEKLNDIEVSKGLEELEEQLENEKGSADGKMKIFDGLRKELFKLDNSEKASEWTNVEQEMKNTFYELEKLVDKINEYGDDKNLNMEKVDAHLIEYRTKIEQIIKEKALIDAKNLIRDIEQLDFELRNIVSDNAMDVQFLKHISENFSTYHWKDSNKAKQFINQGTKLVTEGKTNSIRPILHQLIDLMPEGEKPATLG